MTLFSLPVFLLPSVVLTAVWVDAGGGNSILDCSGWPWPLCPHADWHNANVEMKRSSLHIQTPKKDARKQLCPIPPKTQHWIYNNVHPSPNLAVANIYPLHILAHVIQSHFEKVIRPLWLKTEQRVFKHWIYILKSLQPLYSRQILLHVPPSSVHYFPDREMMQPMHAPWFNEKRKETFAMAVSMRALKGSVGHLRTRCTAVWKDVPEVCLRDKSS